MEFDGTPVSLPELTVESPTLAIVDLLEVP